MDSLTIEGIMLLGEVMKTYFAVGDKSFKVPVVIHNSGLGRCSIFKSCPPVHADKIPEEDKTNNFKNCTTFKLFDSHEEACKYADDVRFMQFSGGPNVFITFKVMADENLVPNSDTDMIEVNADQIARLDESYIDIPRLFGNTTQIVTTSL